MSKRLAEVRFTGVVLWAVATAGLGVLNVARAEHTRVTNPSAFGLELLGRGIGYTIFFDRVLDDDLVAGIGYGTASVSGQATSARLIPAYFNYYLARQQGSLYVTAGATMVMNSGDVQGGSTSIGGITINSGVLPTFGVGYENRSDAGYLFRVAGYGMIAESFSPWAGFSLGYSF